MRNAALAVVLLATACVRLSPTDRAQSLVRQHKETEAVNVLRDDLAKHPDDLPARRLLVRVLAYTGDLEGAVRAIKAAHDGEIDVAGPRLAHSLAELGLVDEFRIYLHPVVAGHGKPYFAAARRPSAAPMSAGSTK